MNIAIELNELTSSTPERRYEERENGKYFFHFIFKKVYSSKKIIYS